MIFINNSKIYAKVWKVHKFDKYIDLEATTSEKDQDGNYVNSGWFPRLIGHAFNALKDTIKEGDRIVITKAKLTNERYTAKDGSTKSAFKFVVLEASIADEQGAAQNATVRQEAPVATEQQGDEECPW